MQLFDTPKADLLTPPMFSTDVRAGVRLALSVSLFFDSERVVPVTCVGGAHVTLAYYGVRVRAHAKKKK